MDKSQMYFPVNSVIKSRIEATAHRLSVPASNIISEIITQAFEKPEIDFKISVPSVPVTTDQEIEKAAKKFARGDHGKKHHLID